jgi:hypothetical protein
MSQTYRNIPDPVRKTKNIKKVTFTTNPSSKGLQDILKPIMGNDELRPVMAQAFYYKDKGVAATNAHMVAYITAKDQGETEGAHCITEGCFELMEENGYGGKYPNIDAIIPLQTMLAADYKIEVDPLRKYAKTIIESGIADKVTAKIIIHIPVPESEDFYVVAMNGRFIIDACEFFLKQGINEVYINYFGEGSHNNRIIIFSEKNFGSIHNSGTWLGLMPLMLD